MTGSIALDVVIGLIFIYLLYSLLATVIMEIVATNLGLRARNLRLAIMKMLSDEEINYWKALKVLWFTNILGRINRFRTENENDLSEKFYNSRLINRLNSSGFFSSPSSISKELFAENMIYLLGDNQENQDDEIHENITNFLANNENDNNEVIIQLRYLFKSSNNDLALFRKKLEKWYEEMMERCTGWYKKRVQVILFFVGLTIACLFNVNTFEIVNILSYDKDTRDKIVQMTSTYITENKELIEAIKNNQNQQLSDTSKTILKLNTDLDSLMNIREKLEKDIDKANLIMGFQPKSIVPVKRWYSKDSLEKNQNIISIAKNERFISKNDTQFLVSFSNEYIAEKTFGYYKISKESSKIKDNVNIQEFKATLNKLKFIWVNFLGYLVTALAISLGAPFWFDLLSKLMKVRGSLKEPLSAENQQTNSNRQKTAKG